MRFPRPEDPAQAPIWDNYVVAQAAAAALGLIPSYAHALGVEVRKAEVCVVIQVPPDAPEHDEDIDDIVSYLEDLVGPDVRVTVRIDRIESRRLRPDDGVRWFFAKRVE